MLGFFNKGQTQSINISKKGKSLSCVTCGLGDYDTGCRLYKHNKESDIMVLYGGISKRERKLNEKRVDDSIIKAALRRFGIDNASIVPVVQCYNDGYTNTHYECCRAQLKKTIREIKPKLIIAMGKRATSNILCCATGSNLDEFGDVAKYRGEVIPYNEMGCRILVTISPAMIRAKEERVLEVILHNDIEKALAEYKRPMPAKWSDHKDMYELIFSEERAIEVLEEALTAKKFCFDYETSGIKPHNPNQYLYSASFTTNGKMAYAFLWPEDPESRVAALWKQILEDPNIKKIAQNMKFEHAWTRFKLGYEIVNWYWDTMLQSHILDNRTGVTSLKHQVFVKFGIKGYEDEIKPFLKSDKKKYGANGVNRIKEAPVERLLIYNALDSLYEYWLFDYQLKTIKRGM